MIVVYDPDKNEFQDYSYTTSYKSWSELIESIETMISERTLFKIYGIWMGTWGTDAFDLIPEEVLKSLKDNILDKEIKKLYMKKCPDEEIASRLNISINKVQDWKYERCLDED